ncbi:MAG: DUF2341 domain-containing protein, partial [Candidatus Altiarchaeota archaeon]|nr:DUF2341 domain-containing protein [Candidatus Altiarchaeota archaeon]
MKRLLLVLLILPGLAFGWWDTSWDYRAKVNLSSSTFFNFSTNFTIDTASLITTTRMNSDCSDLRVVWEGDSEQELDYWPSRDCDASNTLIFTKLVNATANETLYIYYGNSGASSTASASAVFETPRGFFPFETAIPTDVVGSYSASYYNVSVGDLPYSTSGLLGNATYFEDTEDAINVSASLLDSLTNFTFTFWIKTSDLKFTLISGANSTEPNELIFYSEGSNVRLGFGGSQGAISSSISDGAWHHVAWVYLANGTNYLYTDGSLSGSLDLPSHQVYLDFNGLWIGQNQSSVGGGWISGEEFVGYLDDFLVYDRSLASDDILKLSSSANMFFIQNQTRLLLNASAGTSSDSNVNLKILQGATVIDSGSGTILDGFPEAIYNLSASKYFSGEHISVRVDNFDFSDQRDTLFQFDDAYSGSLTWDVDSITPICAATVPGQWDRAFITIPKKTHTIDKILHCTSWNFVSKACSSWTSNDTSAYSGFGQNSSHFWFYATQFDAYGGGNLSLPDLQVKKITFNVSTFQEDDFVKIGANISNAGGQSVSSVKVWLNTTDCNSVELPFLEETVDLLGGEWKVVNFTSNFSICTFTLNVTVDPTNVISESNEFNNFNLTNITIPSWGYFHGNISSEIVLANEDFSNVSLWAPQNV